MSSPYTDVRSNLIEIIGYQGETCLPDAKPVTAFFTDRYLSPVLDGLVKYIEEIRADERKRAHCKDVDADNGKDEDIAYLEGALSDSRHWAKETVLALADLRAKVEGLPSNGYADDQISREAVLALLRGKS